MSVQRSESLILIPDYVSTDGLSGQLFGTGILGDAGKVPGELRTDRFLEVNDPEVRKQVIRMVPKILRAKIITPSAAFYRRVAELRDDCFFSDLTLRLLMGGADVTIFSGFLRERVPKRLQVYLQQITEDGAHIAYRTAEISGKPKPSLITAAEVAACYHQGRFELEAAPGAIITPAARDEAKELGVTILNDKGGEP